MTTNPLDRLRHHVTGAIERGEAAPIVEQPRLVRESSPAGPCLTLGRYVRETAQFYVYAEWHGGDRFGPRERRIKKDGRVHVEPCTRCRDHAATVYPNGYMD